MPSTVQVRRATAEEVPQITKLMQEYYAASPVPNPFSVPAMTRYLKALTVPNNSRGTLLVALQPTTPPGQALGGFAVAYLGYNTRALAPQVELADLFVTAEWRRQGAARKLIRGVAAYARQRQASRIIWQTRTSNVGAQTLYNEIATQETGWLHYAMEL